MIIIYLKKKTASLHNNLNRTWQGKELDLG